jgi:hypothetical protein
MKELIACCGIDCESCDARIATVNDDDVLRKETAEKWREAYQSPEITAESINCTGCRMEGAKISHYYDCPIRKCVEEKGFNTCGECKELETCEINFVLQHIPDAKENLKI